MNESDPSRVRLSTLVVLFQYAGRIDQEICYSFLPIASEGMESEEGDIISLKMGKHFRGRMVKDSEAFPFSLTSYVHHKKKDTNIVVWASQKTYKKDGCCHGKICGARNTTEAEAVAKHFFDKVSWLQDQLTYFHDHPEEFETLMSCLKKNLKMRHRLVFKERPPTDWPLLTKILDFLNPNRITSLHSVQTPLSSDSAISIYVSSISLTGFFEQAFSTLKQMKEVSRGFEVRAEVTLERFKEEIEISEVGDWIMERFFDVDSSIEDFEDEIEDVEMYLERSVESTNFLSLTTDPFTLDRKMLQFVERMLDEDFGSPEELIENLERFFQSKYVCAEEPLLLSIWVNFMKVSFIVPFSINYSRLRDTVNQMWFNGMQSDFFVVYDGQRSGCIIQGKPPVISGKDDKVFKFKLGQKKAETKIHLDSPGFAVDRIIRSLWDLLLSISAEIVEEEYIV